MPSQRAHTSHTSAQTAGSSVGVRVGKGVGLRDGFGLHVRDTVPIMVVECKIVEQVSWEVVHCARLVRMVGGMLWVSGGSGRTSA